MKQAPKNDLIESIVAQIDPPAKAEKGENLEAFIRSYFHQVASVDLAAAGPVTLYRAALAHFQFGQRRSAGRLRLRIYNPNQKQHGWASTHSVMEVVCPDMPFLVDSLRRWRPLRRSRRGSPRTPSR